MPTTALVWFRRDLRVHDHPPLTAAHRESDRVVPVFVLDPRLLDGGRFPSANRAWFLLESLRELRAALRERGGELFVREGTPERELLALAGETGAGAVHFASDVSPFAMARDRRVVAALEEAGVAARRHPGNFVADVGVPRTTAGGPFTVFSPFWRRWEKLPRREVHGAPRSLSVPSGLRAGAIPHATPEAAEPLAPGEAAARERLRRWLDGPVDAYHERHDRLAGGTSELSPALHFGCLSAREAEERARRRGGRGALAFVRQLAWRDFYAHVLLHHPGNAKQAHKLAFEALTWSDDDADGFDAWREGRTGFPVIDAGMRELRRRGWMHNRARLLTAAFLTKDLHLDWRLGEAHFMRHLLCGDEAQNNGNWQWVTSIGVDPAPYFRRMYNPMTQQRRHDPEGAYVRRWCPELRDVPLERLAEPWTMSRDEQEAAGCVIGRHYPAPIVDHKRERERAMERYRAIAG